MNPLTLLTLLLPTLALALYAPKCKTYPEDAAWPAPQDWQSLNTTVNGNLIKYTPPAAVCAPLSPLFNPSKCADVKKLWGYQAFATADPGLISAIRFTNNSCNPDAGVCSQGYYPVYVVAAKNAADVAAAVRFARKRNVRLNIKNTGHVRIF